MYHSADTPHFALYSKNRQEKDAYAAWLMAHIPHDFCLYLCPKDARSHLARQFPSAYLVDIEKFTQKHIFLNILSMATEQTLVILENISRYTVLSSDKFNCLQRLRMKTRNRYLIDIVPFTKDITKLYLPYSYLDREILGYSNGWAFSYNYAEQDASGRIRRAHDLDFLAEKLHPYCHQSYQQFLPCNWRIMESHLTDEEQSAYAARKEQLFEEYTNPAKIVTEICDFANMVDSRKEQLATLLASLDEAVIYTNITKNTPPIKRYLKARGLLEDRRIEFRTYCTHDAQPVPYKNVILFETPINLNRVAALDVFADVPEDAAVYHFRNDAKADQYIYAQVTPEWDTINALTREIARVQQEATKEEEQWYASLYASQCL